MLALVVGGYGIGIGGGGWWVIGLMLAYIVIDVGGTGVDVGIGILMLLHTPYPPHEQRALVEAVGLHCGCSAGIGICVVMKRKLQPNKP